MLVNNIAAKIRILIHTCNTKNVVFLWEYALFVSNLKELRQFVAYADHLQMGYLKIL
jgi:hypothetical protein